MLQPYLIIITLKKECQAKIILLVENDRPTKLICTNQYQKVTHVQKNGNIEPRRHQQQECCPHIAYLAREELIMSPTLPTWPGKEGH
jgi:hypothetical protein